MTDQTTTPDLRDEIGAARELVMELTRRAQSDDGFGGETHTHLGRACQLLLAAEDAETYRLQMHYLDLAAKGNVE